MQIRLRRNTLALGLGALIMTGCGRPATATVLPLPPFSTTVAQNQATQTAQPQTPISSPEPTPAPVSPDLPPGSGRLVYYTTAGGKGSEIEIVPASGGATLPAAFPRDRSLFTDEMRSPWSPDRRYVIGEDRRASADDERVFVVAAADGSNLREVARIPATDRLLSGDFVWSPDSSKVAVIMKDAFNDPESTSLYASQRLLVIDVAGGSASVVVDDVNLNNDHLAWSPDSQSLAFSTGESHEPEIPRSLQTIRWDGSNQRTMVEDVYVLSIFWTRENTILFEGECDGNDYTELCQLDPASGNYQPLYQTPDRNDTLRFFSLSPDERWLFAMDYRRNAFTLINRASGAVEVIPGPASDFYSFSSLWSPDSRYVAVWGQDKRTYVYEVGSGRPLRPLISEIVLAWLPEK
ncbi:MAG TPA: hypothetical protein VD886_10210 [Herpetosiphonaceae bacterium]|nr:hypothetical protein [Herpetosiphonaceae bacterium]